MEETLRLSYIWQLVEDNDQRQTNLLQEFEMEKIIKPDRSPQKACVTGFMSIRVRINNKT
jgi:hypothetical protein